MSQAIGCAVLVFLQTGPTVIELVSEKGRSTDRESGSEPTAPASSFVVVVLAAVVVVVVVVVVALVGGARWCQSAFHPQTTAATAGSTVPTAAVTERANWNRTEGPDEGRV